MHAEREHPGTPIMPVGMAFWLLSGGSGPERVAWIADQGFQSLSLLINNPDADDPAHDDTARAIRDSGLLASCHPNYQCAVKPDGSLDTDRIHRLNDQVLAWHAHAGGMYAACADPIVVPTASGDTIFSMERNREAMRIAADAFRPAGIRFGWENTFGSPDRCQSAGDINRFAAACAIPGLGLLLDLGHLNIHLHSPGAPTQDPEAFLQQLAVDIHEVHVTDNLGQRDEHRHLGYGNLDLAAVMRGLCTIGYRGPLVVEVCVDILAGRYCSDIHDPAQTAPVLATRDRLQDAIAWFDA